MYDVYNRKIPSDVYECPYCGTKTFEDDRYHYRFWDSEGGHCIVGGKQVN